MAIWYANDQLGEPLLGDLDEADGNWLRFVAPAGMDKPYDSDAYGPDGSTGREHDDDVRWEEWRNYAAQRDRPMESMRDVISFMLELGLVEKHGEGAYARWVLPDRLLHPDEVLPLSERCLQELTEMRWRLSFSDAADAITEWIAGHRVAGADEITISIETLALATGLDPNDARHGLAILIDDDIRCDLDPESAPAGAPLQLTIDWALFEEWRTVYKAAPPDVRD